MSNDGVVKFRLIVDFDALRARFGEQIYAHLLVWDEIRQELIMITPGDGEKLSDLTRPGEGFRSIKVEIRPD